MNLRKQYCALAAVLWFGTLAVGSECDSCVRFNQHWLEDMWASDVMLDPHANTFSANCRSEVTESVAIDNPRSVLRFVLSRAPENAVVYPTEKYYYFEFPWGHRLISGNIRFVDAVDAVIHVGYFDRLDRTFFHHDSFAASDSGISVVQTDSVVDVELDSVQRSFDLDRRWLRDDRIDLLDGERLLSGVLDESGFAFWLVYHEPTNALYYVLNEHVAVPDHFVPEGDSSTRFLVGSVSRYVFYIDRATNRKILVGVDAREIFENSYFDGPFDQVPPRLSIGPILESVYPYVKMRGGIDEHGNFIELDHQRVAISPYQSYDSVLGLVQNLRSIARIDLDGPARWFPMIYESKRDFHLRTTEATIGQGAVHELSRSRRWPANHWFRQSNEWGDAHNDALSLKWPPNHDSKESREHSDDRDGADQ